MHPEQWKSQTNTHAVLQAHTYNGSNNTLPLQVTLGFFGWCVFSCCQRYQMQLVLLAGGLVAVWAAGIWLVLALPALLTRLILHLAARDCDAAPYYSHEQEESACNPGKRIAMQVTSKALCTRPCSWISSLLQFALRRGLARAIDDPWVMQNGGSANVAGLLPLPRIGSCRWRRRHKGHIHRFQRPCGRRCRLPRRTSRPESNECPDHGMLADSVCVVVGGGGGRSPGTPVGQHLHEPLPGLMFARAPQRIMQVAGTRGDVQPATALGVRLRSHGHHVRIAAHAPYRGLVEGAGEPSP